VLQRRGVIAALEIAQKRQLPTGNRLLQPGYVARPENAVIRYNGTKSTIVEAGLFE
jgi:hypothetical protein